MRFTGEEKILVPNGAPKPFDPFDYKNADIMAEAAQIAQDPANFAHVMHLFSECARSAMSELSLMEGEYLNPKSSRFVEDANERVKIAESVCKAKEAYAKFVKKQRDLHDAMAVINQMKRELALTSTSPLDKKVYQAFFALFAK